MPTERFSLLQLKQTLPQLYDRFVWKENEPVPPHLQTDLLHIGCGKNVLDGFVNVDVLPENDRVLNWNLLCPWPANLPDEAFTGIFSEDTLEHFFYGEQAYILAQANRVLSTGGVLRILMPSARRMLGVYDHFSPDPNRYLVKTFGAMTAADAVNAGLRGSGHRWLHDDESLSYLAKMCGFEGLPTSCSESREPRFVGLNKRNEKTALSFAQDLVKTDRLNYIRLSPEKILHSTLIEELEFGQALYLAETDSPRILYYLPQPVEIDKIALLSPVGLNLSQFDEHNFATVFCRTESGTPFSQSTAIALDQSQKSVPFLNVVTHTQLRLRCGKWDRLLALRFDPGKQKGDYFSVGPLEVFFTS